jgi:hypothetical protein
MPDRTVQKIHIREPNVVVEWLKHLLRIWNVQGSNLGPDTGYPD